MNGKEFTEKIKNYIKYHNMLEQKDSIVIGVSGGADSMCLLSVLNELFGGNRKIIVVHVNHGLRENAAYEAKYVESYCKDNCIECHVINENVALLAQTTGVSTEEAGRLIRYREFERYANSENAVIAVAHNKNDQAETMLHNMFRGSSISGLCGIRPVRDNIIRPLLCATRDEIEQYLGEKGIHFCTDESNLTDEYTRNKIRHNIIPYVKDNINQLAVDNMFSLSEDLLDIKEYLDEQTRAKYLEYVSVDENGIRILEEIRNEKEYIISSVIYKCFVDLAGKMKDVERKHIKLIRELLAYQVGKKIDLPYGITAKRTYDGILLIRYDKASQAPDEFNVKLTVDGQNIFEDMIISCETTDDITGSYPKEKYTKWFDYDKIINTLCVRNRQPEDYIIISQDGKKKSLNRFFIDQKIPEEMRDNIKLICDGNHVLWIVGYRDSAGMWIDNSTKNILKITISFK